LTLQANLTDKFQATSYMFSADKIQINRRRVIKAVAN
jgi:hypothetical protein